MCDNEYIGGKDASEILGVHQRTLYLWDKKQLIETIRTPGGKRLYNVNKYLEEHKTNINKITNELKDNTEKLNICYVRVSSLGQADDLKRQKAMMQDKYPTYEIIEDIGLRRNK
jgi:predicted site-specific integrase-resolvase